MVADAGLPGAQLLLVASVGEGEHRLGVLDLFEALQRRSSDPLGGRVRGAKLGMGGLERAQLVEQGVVFVVVDDRVVEDVVAAVVLRQFPTQLGGARGGVRHRPRASPRSPSRAACPGRRDR